MKIAQRVKELWVALGFVYRRTDGRQGDRYIPRTFRSGDKKVREKSRESLTVALPRHQEEEETDKSKQAQIEQTYEKH